MTAERTRDSGLMLRLNLAERALLESLAAAMALTLSDTIRQCLRAEAKRRGLNVKPKRAKR